MDKLLRGIQSQTIDLCIFDLVPSFVNMPFYFYYGNDTNDSDFMPAEQLRESFYTALLDFPILVGHLETDGSGHAKVVVDKDNLNIPEFLESQSSVHFRDLQAAQFSWDALPSGVNTVGAVTSADSSGVIKAANVHVVRLQDNSGIVLFISMAHYIADGVGYCAFINRWAELCRWIRSASATTEKPACHYNFERSSLFDKLPEGRKALDGPTLELITSTGPFVRWLAWISPKTRAILFRMSFNLMSVVSHVFHIPASRFASLRASVQGYLSSDVRLSDNDILTALLAMAIAQSEAECKQDSASASYISSLASYLFPSMYTPASNFVTQVVIDTRPRLKGLSAANYTGNSVLTRCLVNSMESLTSGIHEQSLAPIAKSVRQLVNGIDPQYIGQFVDTLHKDPLCFMCPATYAFSKTTMVLSNQSRFPLYEADFGDGIPRWVSPIQTFFPNFLSIMPAPPSTGGYVVYISMTERAMAKILQNKFWMSTSDMVY
ncbi:hypothetical protein IW146_000532 [Coemansia sp. RSA 922]|nr:hypothetical protein H4S03_001885 [Coemansia sp. S3946]KAJ2069178.1 hypothetical protein GGH13_004621 [Coemansia sp. S155-1]KAJ2117685.1 hypothetical protein IW146_000532 [Coemansia sp. RSA 922]KAJ2351939.1 hypothetical protein GGH92_001546 [Coemansia sp. RSA 2673]